MHVPTMAGGFNLLANCGALMAASGAGMGVAVDVEQMRGVDLRIDLR